MISEIGTERTMQVLKVSEGPVQPVGFQRNQEEIYRSKEASIENKEVFCEIKDSQEENDPDKPALDLSSMGLSQSLIKTVIVKTNMCTGSAKTSYFNCHMARTVAKMSEDWIVVPNLGRGLRGSR